MVHRPGRPWAWFWRLTPQGRDALDQLEQDDQLIQETRTARCREADRYPEIAGQANRLEKATRENGFVSQLSQGFHPRMT